MGDDTSLKKKAICSDRQLNLPLQERVLGLKFGQGVKVGAFSRATFSAPDTS